MRVQGQAWRKAVIGTQRRGGVPNTQRVWWPGDQREGLIHMELVMVLQRDLGRRWPIAQARKIWHQAAQTFNTLDCARGLGLSRIGGPGGRYWGVAGTPAGPDPVWPVRRYRRRPWPCWMFGWSSQLGPTWRRRRTTTGVRETRSAEFSRARVGRRREGREVRSARYGRRTICCK